MLKVLLAKTVKPGTKFRCRMFVFNFTGDGRDSEFIDYLSKDPNDNPIWSDTVVIP
jgi:hypothetical protein